MPGTTQSRSVARREMSATLGELRSMGAAPQRLGRARRMGKLKALAVLAVSSCLFIASCGGNSDESKAQVASLQTQLAKPTEAPTATPSPTATPAPDTAAFCAAVGDFRSKRSDMVERFNELSALHTYFDDFTISEVHELEALQKLAAQRFIPLPPKEAANATNASIRLSWDLRPPT